ncbi:TIGR03619 family F420-dependent LLM class oxidoreductase [Cryptosporangium aurantiacum]|uniref:Probable F420-dependent oxidoreductase, Rv2161c family n=1 Tax=Cryptosporangium aurantiacum TaxID=134849 RepID=A0A1M7RDV2_9ACTN|nr:TIGR03619 family F420-dependent LLM class oxidoreductase [Cryptosporangium aurantiacum]SHN44396.1 probable F420-dependent oxidoreductase, Rv2161c family [Cryptosporangium aurantiacum]
MKFGVSYSTATAGTDPDRLVGFARHAEASGFESFYVNEHLVLYPGAKIGPMALPPTLPFADPLDCLSFVAASTERILLGTAVLLLPYRHPVVLAKRLATIDTLSKGRMRLLTVGVGTLPGEAAAVGVDFASRGRRTDEAIDVLRLLWAGDEHGVSHSGEFFAFENICIYPKPYGTTNLPIHVGGSSLAAARRAGRRGDGFFPGGFLSPEERTAQFEIARAASPDPDSFEYTRWGSIDLTPAQVEAYAAQGVTRLVVGAGTTDELSAFAERFQLVP